MCIGINLSRMGSNRRLLWTRRWVPRFHKRMDFLTNCVTINKKGSSAHHGFGYFKHIIPLRDIHRSSLWWSYQQLSCARETWRNDAAKFSEGHSTQRNETAILGVHNNVPSLIKPVTDIPKLFKLDRFHWHKGAQIWVTWLPSELKLYTVTPNIFSTIAALIFT
jgi:hypothetical protein